MLRVLHVLLNSLYDFKPGQNYPLDPLIPLFFLYILIGSLQSIVPMSWLAYAAYSNYRNIRKSQIKTWVKARYVIIVISSLFFTADAFLSLLLIINDFQIIIFLIYVSFFDASLFSIGSFICWVVPIYYHIGEYKYKENLEELQEKDIKTELSEESEKLEIINYLGEIITTKVKISAPAARGLLRLAIKDELGPFMKIKDISFEQIQKVIENSLEKRLIDLNISNFKVVIDILLKELIKNQSLLTLEKV